MAELPDDWPSAVRARLFEERVVVVSGVLDDAVAGQAAAELMALDASGDDPVHLHLDCGGGTLGAALVLVDCIDLLGVPVHAVCLGRAEGPPVAVVAVAHRRLAAPHARFRLCAPEESVQGRAGDLQRWVDDYRDRQRRFVARLAQATHRSPESVQADIDAGRYLDAPQAVAYRLVDEVMSPGSAVRPVPSARPFGFRSPRRR